MSKHNGSNIICTEEEEEEKKKTFFGLFILYSWRPDEEMMDPLVQRTSGLSQRIPPARRRRRRSRNNIAEPLCQIIVPRRRHTQRHNITCSAHACELVCVVSYKTYHPQERQNAYLVYYNTRILSTCKNTLYPSYIHIVYNRVCTPPL